MTKRFLFFIQKRHGITPVPHNSDGNFARLDIIASYLTIAISQVYNRFCASKKDTPSMCRNA